MKIYHTHLDKICIKPPDLQPITNTEISVPSTTGITTHMELFYQKSQVDAGHPTVAQSRGIGALKLTSTFNLLLY